MASQRLKLIFCAFIASIITFLAMVGCVILSITVIISNGTVQSNNTINTLNQFTAMVPGALITSTPSLITAIERDAPMTDCDGVGSFYCQTGTCYTGHDGFVGCCSVKSCAARTTCIPYTATLKQACDQNTGGCVVCLSENPLCVTITNIVANQYIMYCTTKSLDIITYSYENLISTGSMAPAPSSLMTTAKVMSTSSATSFSVISTRAAGSVGQTSAMSATPTSTSSEHPAKLPESALIGTAVGIAVFAVLFISCVVTIFLINRKDSKFCNKAEGQINGEGFFSRERNKSTVSLTGRRKLQKQNRSTQNDGNIVTTHANDPEDFLSPIQYERLALEAQHRDIERVYEMMSPLTHPRYLRGQEDWWDPPETNSPQDASPSVRWSGSTGRPVAVEANSTNIGESEQAIELSTIRHVRSLEEIHPAATDAVPTFSPVSSVGQFSPPMTNTSFAPTPLMPQHRNFDRASVGQPLALSATVDGPLNWPSRQRFVPSNSGRASSSGDMTRSLTSATGGGATYVTPEAAMVGEFVLGAEDEDEV